MRRSSLFGALVVSGFALTPSCNLFFAFAPDQVCETLVRAQCRHAFACCEATERLQFTAVGQFRNEGECIQELLEEGGGNCLNSFQVQEATQQARFTYDTALAEKCIKPAVDALNNCQAAALDANALDDLVPDECDDILGVAFGKGLVKNGEQCFQNFECEVPDSVCEPLEDEDEEDGQVVVTSVGLCNQPAKIGEDCSDDAATPPGLCEDGSFCEAEDQECVALFDNGDECVVDEECLSEFCNNVDPNVTPECDDFLEDGEDCLENDDCLSELCALNDDDELVCTAQDVLVIQACNGLQGDDTQF